MTAPLTVAARQPLIEPGRVAANAERHAAAVEEAGADLVVFPELSLTGYHFDAPAVPVHDDRLAPLVEACRRHGSTALVGAPVAAEAGPARSIGVLAVDGRGARIAYRKVNLGAAEAPHFAPGPGPAAIEVAGWRVGLAVCRDTGIAVHAADTAALGIDLYAAGVLEHDTDRAEIEERAARIATDHRVWVAVASFAGSTGEGYVAAAGRSGIWSPDGRAVDRAGPEPGDGAMATVSDLRS